MVNFIPPANQWAHVIIRFEALIFPKKPLLAHKRSGNFGLLLHCRPVNVLNHVLRPGFETSGCACLGGQG